MLPLSRTRYCAGLSPTRNEDPSYMSANLVQQSCFKSSEVDGIRPTRSKGFTLERLSIVQKLFQTDRHLEAILQRRQSTPYD